MSYISALVTFVTDLEEQVVNEVTPFRPITLPDTPAMYNRFRTARFDGTAIGIKKDVTTVTAVLAHDIKATDDILDLADTFIDLVDPILYANAYDSLPQFVALAKRQGWSEAVDSWGDTTLRTIEFPIEVEINEPIVVS
jgi:hypothetical protein